MIKFIGVVAIIYGLVETFVWGILGLVTVIFPISEFISPPTLSDYIIFPLMTLAAIFLVIGGFYLFALNKKALWYLGIWTLVITGDLVYVFYQYFQPNNHGFPAYALIEALISLIIFIYLYSKQATILTH